MQKTHLMSNLKNNIYTNIPKRTITRTQKNPSLKKANQTQRILKT